MTAVIIISPNITLSREKAGSQLCPQSFVSVFFWFRSNSIGFYSECFFSYQIFFFFVDSASKIQSPRFFFFLFFPIIYSYCEFSILRISLHLDIVGFFFLIDSYRITRLLCSISICTISDGEHNSRLFNIQTMRKKIKVKKFSLDKRMAIEKDNY